MINDSKDKNKKKELLEKKYLHLHGAPICASNGRKNDAVLIDFGNKNANSPYFMQMFFMSEVDNMEYDMIEDFIKVTTSSRKTIFYLRFDNNVQAFEHLTYRWCMYLKKKQNEGWYERNDY